VDGGGRTGALNRGAGEEAGLMSRDLQTGERATLPSPYMGWPNFEFEGRRGEPSVCEVRIFSATNVGPDYVTAVVTNLSADEDKSVAPVAAALANKIVEEFDLEPARFIYVEYYPAAGASLIQERLIVPATPARFVRVRFDYERERGFAGARREMVEITEVAYLTNTPVEGWLRELEETAACNRLYAMLGELGPARTFELIERALQRQREFAEAQAQSGADHGYGADVWERIRLAVVQLVLCAEKAVLPGGDDEPGA
jgi:hypothetical protein